MITSTNPETIKDDLRNLATTYDVPSAEIDSICDDIDSLVSEYDEEITSIKDERDIYAESCDELECELDEYKAGSVETYASKILFAFTGHEPNLGEVLSLKDDLEKLLTTKYNISLGNL